MPCRAAAAARERDGPALRRRASHHDAIFFAKRKEIIITPSYRLPARRYGSVRPGRSTTTTTTTRVTARRLYSPGVARRGASAWPHKTSDGFHVRGARSDRMGCMIGQCMLPRAPLQCVQRPCPPLVNGRKGKGLIFGGASPPPM
ncbi:hypothetical protein GQ55_5G246500 [Panicum hallii var. hallii]|uniref:Uncharacterized protein n=1 Tax=Panicum hallii var. hallii TaxID=1504633 RepID=A0A2T7DJV5_9POAL|nr:hypothetical protein GQ55_5G246500 [Panicum hallii var. hallii]